MQGTDRQVQTAQI